MAGQVAFLLPDLGGGGAERLTLELARAALARGQPVDLVLARARGDLLPMVPAGVRVIDLGAARLRQVMRPLRAYLRSQQPRALIAAMWPLPLLALVASARLNPRPRVIAAEHCSLLAQYRRQPWRRLALRAGICAAYRRADGLVAVSDGLAGELAGLAGVAPARVTTIWNPVPRPATQAAPPTDVAGWAGGPGVRLLSVGRLAAQKNQALLIDMLAVLVQRGIDARLAIVGQGDERDALRARAAALGLVDRVLVPGFTAHPGDWYAAADLFVLASDYEGAGNVLIEALHFGLPVVSTDCPHGPAEILGHGRWGRLAMVGDAAGLAEAVIAALAAPPDPAEQRRRAAEFSVDRALDGYLRLAGQA